MKSPKLLTNCPQFAKRTGLFSGPVSARPTNAATAVPTPSMGRDPLSTSSTKTPGERYVGTLGLLGVGCQAAGILPALQRRLNGGAGGRGGSRARPKVRDLDRAGVLVRAHRSSRRPRHDD